MSTASHGARQAPAGGPAGACISVRKVLVYQEDAHAQQCRDVLAVFPLSELPACEDKLSCRRGKR
jgi:hypothetical protein